MSYFTKLFVYAEYFPAIGFFIGMIWGFAKSGNSRSGGMGFVMSILIGGAIGLVVGVVARFFASYVMTAQSHPGLY